jgi:hypothetical protein
VDDYLICLKCYARTDILIGDLCETCWRRASIHIVKKRPQSWWEHLWPFRWWKL